MSPVEAGFEQQVEQVHTGPNGLHWRGDRPLGYAETTPATTTSRVPPVASPGAKQLWRQLTEYPEARDHVGAALDIIAERDPRDIMDLRWAWKVRAPLE